MKKIGLFLHSRPDYGGAFQYNQSMLHALCSFPEEQYEIVVAYFYQEWEPYLEKLPIKAVLVSDQPWSRHLHRKWREKGLPYDLWRELTGDIHPVGSVLKDEKCDLWIFPSQDFYTYQLDVPALGTIHDLMHRYESHFPEVRDEYVHRERIYTNICLYAKGVLVDSEVGKSHVMESYSTPEQRIFTLPFIPPQYIYDFEQNQMKVSEMSILNLPSKYIFYPAQFWEHKNHARLIEAINLLKDEDVIVHLVLSGSFEDNYRKNEFNKLNELIRKYALEDQVTYVGYVKDEQMPYLYKHARALIMPTCFGPTNIPPLEAFVMGCPVATSNIYGIPDQLKEGAIYFDPTSVSEIAACIQSLWHDDVLCQKLIQKGFERSREWGKDQFKNRLLEIVDELIE